jgi:hypothetical protein
MEDAFYNFDELGRTKEFLALHKPSVAVIKAAFTGQIDVTLEQRQYIDGYEIRECRRR